MRSKVSYAVAVILSGVSYRALAAQPLSTARPTETSPPSQTLAAPARTKTTAPPAVPRALAEVIVTATRRSENVQNVPITMQALTGRMLRQLHVSTFEDYVRMLPNLTSADNGPGQNEIFMRGASAGSQATQASGIIGLWPNVGVYLDNQAVSLPGQNLDVYLADMNRIEVLEGPQGTLFGSGAEAGAIRYITNKPVLDKIDGNVNASYGVTAHGGPNSSVTGVLNLPIIPHHLATRFVVYNDRQGGYINNVYGTFTRKDTDFGIHYANFFVPIDTTCPDGGQPNTFRAPAGEGACVPPGSPVLNNNGLVGNHINPVTYQGGRVEALYQFDADWSLLVTQMYQNMDADGVFYQNPTSPDGQKLPPLEVVLFTPTYHKDRFSNTAWTLKGKVGVLNAIYTGGLLTRHDDNEMDYTNYQRGVYGDYYQCYGPGTGGDNSLTPTCFSAVEPLISNQQNIHWQHELRVETPENWRLRGIAGIYYEDNVVYDQTYFMNESVPACTSNGPPGTPGNTGCFATDGTFPGATVKFPGLQKYTSFFDDAKREERQIAEYLSVSFNLTPHLTITGGARHFVFLNSLVGVVQTAFGCFEGGTPPTGCHDPAYSTDLNAEKLRDTESGWRYQANISWRVDPVLSGHRQHILTYFTFSQGFRPGGFNQNGGSLHGLGPDGQPQFAIPESYSPDELNNFEVGWKTDWRLLNRYFQWNAAFYRENWDNVQISFFDPGFTGTAFFDDNGQNFRIDGAETSVVAQLWRGLTFRGAAAWNSSEQTNSPVIIDNNPASVNFGKPITEICATGPSSCTPLANPFGPRGAPTADSPPIHYTLLLRYDFPINAGSYFGYLNGAVGHIQFGMQHQGHSYTQAGSNPPFLPGETIDTGRARFNDPAYTIYDASVGVSQGRWSITAYGENLTNSNAAVFTSTDQFIVAQTPLRPRIVGVRFGYSF